MQRKLLFLDRDGTLIVDKIYLNDPSLIEYLPGAIDGLKKLRRQGFEFLFVTNQSGLARGIVQIQNLNEIHRRIRAHLSSHGIDVLSFYYAPYSVQSNHWMRKPNPGMIELGLQQFRGNRQASWMVGDRETDLIAGQKAGLNTGFLLGTENPQNLKSPPNLLALNWDDLVQQILEQDRSKHLSFS